MMEADPRSESLATQVIGAAIRIHRRLGPGLMESVYEALLAAQLREIGLTVHRQQAISFTCDGASFECGFRVDLLVERRLVVELKSVTTMNPVFSRQLLTYLRLMNLDLGLVINFGAPLLRDGIKRVINTMPPL